RPGRAASKQGACRRLGWRRMSRGRFWLFLLPLLVAGCESAHALLDRFAPASYKGAELFEASGGGGELLPLLAAARRRGALARAASRGGRDRRHCARDLDRHPRPPPGRVGRLVDRRGTARGRVRDPGARRVRRRPPRVAPGGRNPPDLLRRYRAPAPVRGGGL